MSFRVTLAGPADQRDVHAVLSAADLSSRQGEFLAFTLGAPALRTYLARDGSQVLGTALAVSFGPTGWIGNVAVHPSHRRRGVGQAVTEAALGWLTEAGAARVRLLATEMGRPLYERLGFAAEGAPWDKYGIRPALTPIGPTAVRRAPLADCLVRDEEATGDRRAGLLGPFAEDLVQGEEGSGYGLVLPWGGGPVVAATAGEAHALWWHVYGKAVGKRWAVPHDNAAAQHLARAYRLDFAGTSLPMRYGPAPATEPRTDRLWAAWSLAVG